MRDTAQPKRIQRKPKKRINVSLPIIPAVCCPVCLVRLLPYRYNKPSVITFLHCPCSCKFDFLRFEVIVETKIGFPPRNGSE